MPEPDAARPPWDSPTGAHPEPLPLVTESDLVNPLLKVADAMTPAPRTCAPQSTAVEASLIFRGAECGVIPVTEGGKPVGIVTDRDLALAVADRGPDLASTAVGEFMSRDPVTIGPDSTLTLAVERMGREGLRRLLVVDEDGLLVGILSWTDLAPHLSERGLGHVVRQLAMQREAVGE